MTFTRLTLGEPQLKGRPKGEPQEPGGCQNPLVEGSVTGGTGDMEGFSLGQLPEDEASEVPGWYMEPGSLLVVGATNQATISDANPRNGSQHIRAIYEATSEGGNFGLVFVGDADCDTDVQYSARVSPGNLVEATYYLETVSVGGGGEQESRSHQFRWFDSGGNSLGTDSPPDTDDEGDISYTLQTLSVVAPASAYWVEFLIDFTNYSSFDVDDFDLTVTV